MSELIKYELTEIFNNKFIGNIKARIIETCTAYKGVDDAELFSNYINSLDKNEVTHLWNFVKTLGWDTFTLCINEGIKSFKMPNEIAGGSDNNIKNNATFVVNMFDSDCSE